MNEKLIKKAQELRSRGFTTGEIADDLNVSKDTARWLILQGTGKKAETEEAAPLDFAINWKSLGGSSFRMKYVSAAMVDMALQYGEPEVIVGITVSGIPFATMMAEIIDADISVFHPIKHRKMEEDAKGAVSSNFASVEGKKVVIVDDVITSGRTIAEAIKIFKDVGAEPLAAVVLIDKKGISEVEGVPVESLIRVSRLG
ncbi:orotate phosphoribosyltransferase-like protein [Methanobacterium congolense]|jgi:orotate phosphoribosyltransferase|uniref:Transcriptional regulator GfcR n=1 Tax=Methanobacterium congolense TaxID=118062 RepID=A0A1D3L009_9EURY|nr:orotate phosphoribosyltransferase-like protein [Methanobacterium congolense]SCG84915.1 PyrE-like protein [Methanobacterium congolense]